MCKCSKDSKKEASKEDKEKSIKEKGKDVWKVANLIFWK
jgi:hypothetical protein